AAATRRVSKRRVIRVVSARRWLPPDWSRSGMSFVSSPHDGGCRQTGLETACPSSAPQGARCVPNSRASARVDPDPPGVVALVEGVAVGGDLHAGGVVVELLPAGVRGAGVDPDPAVAVALVEVAAGGDDVDGGGVVVELLPAGVRRAGVDPDLSVRVALVEG